MELPKNVFTRRVDELGRVVLPLEFRRALGLEEKDAVVMNMEDGKITIAKAD